MRYARERKRLSQEELAVAATGKERKATVSNWEGDKVQPGPNHLAKAAEALGVSVDWLLTGYAGGEPSYGSAAADPTSDLLRMLWQRLDAIRADSSLTSVERAVREEVELSAYRLALHEIETRTSSDRVRAIREEAELSRGRTERASAVAPVVPSRDPRRREERRRTGTEGG